ncbi:ArnT family glycosyltransferase [Streptantibioticus parmotrematis]|nr:glycosyltransferase family 39 protein [Streptantibioticus parmotrematis]
MTNSRRRRSSSRGPRDVTPAPGDFTTPPGDFATAQLPPVPGDFATTQLPSTPGDFPTARIAPASEAPASDTGTAVPDPRPGHRRAADRRAADRGRRRARPGGERRRAAAPEPAAPRQPAPVWERPALAGVLLLATVLYAWGMGHAAVHPYYAAAVRSMAASWHAFVYGGVDVSGSITIDKLPGGLWPQALSVRVFGPHLWAVALPQVIEGVATVFLLHRIVRAWAGPLGAVFAAAVFALTPVAVVLTRHDIPDTLLTLLLVLAAGAAQKAVRTGGWAPLLTCAVWIGLAFQAKMLQAWLVLPAIALVYQLAAPGSAVRRITRLVAAGALALLVSCSWLLMVWATPAGSRPYLDGTTNNNPFTLVFGYNGLSRFGGNPNALGAVAGTAASRTTGNTGWTMLVNHTVGPQIAWFLPLAVLALVLGVRWRRGEPRTDASRAGFVLWGGWLVMHVLVFSLSNGNHGYYTIVLAPALAALAGGGVALMWEQYQTGGPRRAALPAAIALSAVWATVLEEPHPGFSRWTLPIVLMLGVCGALGLWIRGPRTTRRGVLGALGAGLAATLLAPAAWSLSCLDPVYAGSPTSPLAGPVGTAYFELKDGQAKVDTTALDAPDQRDRQLLGYLQANRSGAKYLVATQAAYSAEPLLRDTAQPMLVMGGFTGLTPFPTAPQLASLVSSHQLRFALLTTQRPSTPATKWVKSNCTRVPARAYGRAADGSFRLYDCASGL